jgi:heptosyltransferase II
MIPSKYKRILFLLYIFFSAPFLYALIFLRQIWNKTYLNKTRFIVLPQLTRVGDLVCTTPVFRAIKEKYPNSWLAVVTTDKVIGIIKNNPHIDEILVYKSNRLFQLIRTIRHRHFDYSFSLSGSMFGNLIFFAGLVTKRAKITRIDRPRSEILTDWMNTYFLEYKHHTNLPKRYLDILRAIDINASRLKMEVFITEESEKQADTFFHNNLSEYSRVVGISITAGNKIKEWGDDKFAHLARRITEQYHSVAIVFIGAKRDEDRINSVLQSLGKGPYFKTVDFSLEALPSLIKRLSLYIAVDTGPIYVAYALSIPLVDITGPVDPWEQPPHNSKSICVMPPAPFLPSSFVLKRPGTKDQHKKSLKRITVEMVMIAVEKLL